MSRIPEQTIAEIKERTDIRDLVESYGITVRRAGSDYKCLCPFHHEKTPSFSINQRTGRWHCYGCGESGDVFQFVQRREGLGFTDAVRRLADRCGIEIAEDKEDEEQARKRSRLFSLHAELGAFFRRCLVQAKEAERAREYLRSRNLDGQVAEDFEIGYVPQAPSSLMRWAKKHGYENEELTAAGVLLPPKEREGGRWYNRFAGRIAFPIRDRMGRTVAFSCRTLETDKTKMVGGKYVNSPETDIFKKSDVLYGLDKAAPNIIQSDGRTAIVCEGQIDVIRLHSCGFNTAVAAQGTAFTKEHVRQLKRCADAAILVFDGDGAGRKAAVKAASVLFEAKMPVKAARMPPGEDPDSLLLGKGAEAMRAVLDDAVSVTAFIAQSAMADESVSDQTEKKQRSAKAVISLLEHCKSAVMRETLLEEAANIIDLPAKAFREDMARSEKAKEEESVNNPPPVPPKRLAVESGIPLAERCLCLLLAENEGRASLSEDVRRILDTRRLTDFTHTFVAAWLEGSESMTRTHATATDDARAEMERILLSCKPDELPLFSPERILADFLRILPALEKQKCPAS